MIIYGMLLFTVVSTQDVSSPDFNPDGGAALITPEPNHWWGETQYTQEELSGNVPAYLDRQEVKCPLGKALTGFKYVSRDIWGHFEYGCADLPDDASKDVEEYFSDCDIGMNWQLVFLDRVHLKCGERGMALAGWHMLRCEGDNQWHAQYWCTGKGLGQDTYEKYTTCELMGDWPSDLDRHLLECDDGEFMSHWQVNDCDFGRRTGKFAYKCIKKPKLCDRIKIDALEVVGDMNTEIQMMATHKFEMNTCGLDAESQTKTLVRTQRTAKTETYTLSESLTNTFAHSLSDSYSLDVSTGFSFFGFNNNIKSSTKHSEDKKWGRTDVSSNQKVFTTMTEDFESTTVPIEAKCPANRVCQHVYAESSTVGTVEWKANAHCLDENWEVIQDPKVVHGTFAHSESNDFSHTHTITECPALKTANGCTCKNNWWYENWIYNGCSQVEGKPTYICYVNENDPNCIYDNMKVMEDGGYIDTCDPKYGRNEVDVDAFPQKNTYPNVLGIVLAVSSFAVAAGVFLYRCKGITEENYEALI